MRVLVLNTGSSSVKYQLFNNGARVSRGELDSHTASGARQAVHHILEQAGRGAFDAVGHRVVHGGERFNESALITDDVLRGIEACVPLAPLHNPGNLEGIYAIRERCGAAMPQVAVFDTAFHATIPPHAYLYPIPYRLYEAYAIRRYGFHGTSHRYVSGRYRELCGLKHEDTHVVTLHLGNGCSAAAVRAGVSVDTSMGMTPLEGLMMGTRSGDVDPSLVGIIAKRESLAVEDVETMLNKASGLLGVSGVTSDMKQLLALESEPRVRLALDMFCYRARKCAAAMLAAAGGAQALVFTGGIGENAAVIRERITAGLAWAGLTIDAARNKEANRKEARISTDDSRLAAWVIPTDEESLIARDTARLVSGAAL